MEGTTGSGGATCSAEVMEVLRWAADRTRRDPGWARKYCREIVVSEPSDTPHTEVAK